MKRKRSVDYRDEECPVFYKKFPRYREIKEYIENLPYDFPDTVRVERLGYSHEGRAIDMVIIQGNPTYPKKAVMIESGIHAREWAAHTTALYIIHHIIRHQSMLEDMDYYIIPCVNPDGYEYTHKCRRLWRKNMNYNGSTNEQNWGVDVNRNFSYGFGRPGSSGNCSSLMYRGKYKLSEPEARCIANALDQYSKYVKLYIALHCYGNVILYPWGFTYRPLPDEKDLRACAHAAQKAMKSAYCNSKFRYGNLAKTMYISSGGSVDFARGIYKIKFSYTIELHKGGKSGFAPKPTQILKIARETLIGIKAMTRHVHRYYLVRKRFLSPSPCTTMTASSSSL